MNRIITRVEGASESSNSSQITVQFRHHLSKAIDDSFLISQLRDLILQEGKSLHQGCLVFCYFRCEVRNNVTHLRSL